MLTNFLGSSFLIIAVFVLRGLLKNKVSKRFIYSLWLVVLLRLLIPMPIFDLGIEPTLPISHDIGATKDRDEYNPPITAENPGIIENVTPGGNITVNEPVSQQPAENIDYASLFRTIRIAGSIITGAWFGYVNLSLYRKLKKDRVKLDTSHNIPVYKTNVLTTPCLFGVVKPAVYLTEAACDERHINNVITHEMCHYRHWDNLWNLLGMVCICLWWWNPLVWISFFTAKRDGELACDELALEMLGENGRVDYGVTLIEMAKNHSGRQLYLATISGGAKEMKERITAIANKRKNVIWAVAIVAVIAVLCTVIGFSGKNTVPDIDTQAAYESFRTHLDKFYKSDEQRTVFDKQGKDFTAEFFVQTQKMYENNDWNGIITYFKNNVGRAKLLIDNRGAVPADWILEEYYMTEIELPNGKRTTDAFYKSRVGYSFDENGEIIPDESVIGIDCKFNSSAVKMISTGVETSNDEGIEKSVGYIDVGYARNGQKRPEHIKRITFDIGLTDEELKDIISTDIHTTESVDITSPTEKTDEETAVNNNTEPDAPDTEPTTSAPAIFDNGTFYGIVTDAIEIERAGNVNATYYFIVDGMEQAHQTYGRAFGVKAGPARFEKTGGSISGIKNLESVTITSISGGKAVSNGKKYDIADDVQVYSHSNGTYSLTEMAMVMNNDDYTLRGYVDGDVRVIIAEPDKNMGGMTAVLIKSFDGTTIVVDLVEYITTADTDRIAQLGLSIAIDMPSGYYVHNEREESLALDVSGAVFEFVDWNRQFV
ncbi:MAG: M56 family metallopeptidase, partial [Clostridia bacterium]|nr:M56 family metallopeptidase [Clostridia bacterium]